MKSAVAGVLLMALSAMASQPRTLMEVDVNAGPTTSWIQGPRPSAKESLTLQVMMRHDAEDIARLEKVLLEVSDPRSSEYGNFLTVEALEKIAPISSEKIDTVLEFLTGAEEIKINPNRDILTVRLSVELAERLFETTIARFHHATVANVTILRAVSSYSLPSNVAASVYVIGDLVHLPALRVTKTAVGSGVGGGTWPNACSGLSGCSGLITPKVLHDRYKVPTDSTGMDASGNSMAVAEFQGQFYKDSDLSKFGSACGLDVKVDHQVGTNQQSAGVESELDIEFAKGLSPGIPLTVVYDAQFSLLGWAQQLSAMSDAPLVNSVSYGNDEKQQTGVAYMDSVNAQFMKLGARGISILFASGDQGVCGREGCGGLFSKTRFKPDFPGGSPYVTAVGGTDFVTYSIGDETAWTGSGGGFSDTFGIPSWQSDVVAAYKANPDAKLPDSSYYNNTGRGYPDVSALGGQHTPYCVVANGVAEGVAGTSASSPVVASIFARLNGLRLKAGKKQLGFLNPWIYQNADAFNDVTSGCNAGSPLNKNCFTAIKGWDPATGVGTPNFEEMSKRL